MIAILALLALAFLLLAGLVTACESAFNFAPRQEVEMLYEDRQTRDEYSILNGLLAEPERYQVALVFWRVWSEMAAAVAVALLFFRLLPNVWLAGLLATAIVGVLGFFFVAMSPRQFGRRNALTFARRTASLVRFLTAVLGPIPHWLSGLGAKANTSSAHGAFSDVSEEELREFVERASESLNIEDGEAELIQSVFDLDDTLVRAVMVPRTDIVSIARGSNVRQALALFIRSGYSRVPVVSGSADDINGILYLKDAVAAAQHHDPGGVVVDTLARPAKYVPESKSVSNLLKELQSESTHLAIVIDEYGGTAGLVTLEDLIEELVGEIVDEYDPATQEVEELEPGRYRISARLSVEDLGELFNKNMVDDDVDTAGGLLAKELGRVPILGSSAQVNGIELTAERFEGRRNRLGSLIVGRVQYQDHEGHNEEAEAHKNEH